jgi:hypothetical protein
LPSRRELPALTGINLSTAEFDEVIECDGARSSR